MLVICLQSLQPAIDCDCAAFTFSAVTGEPSVFPSCVELAVLFFSSVTEPSVLYKYFVSLSSLRRIIGLPTGIISFFLAKRQVDKNRLKQLKIRQRMKRSNEGEYEGSRYRHHAVDVKLDQ